jgi:hypothetical protein
MSLQLATFAMATAATVVGLVRIWQNNRAYRLMKKMAKHAKKTGKRG